MVHRRRRATRTHLALIPLAALTLGGATACGAILVTPPPAGSTADPCASLRASGWSCTTVAPPSPPPVNRAAAAAYLAAHPAAARSGMTAGIVIGIPAPVICPAPSSRGSDARVGYPCLRYAAVLEVAGGAVRAVTCTDLDTAQNDDCEAFWAAGEDQGGAGIDLGDYLYFPSGGQVAGGSGVQVIRRSAVSP
jgi:hypothetical protein